MSFRLLVADDDSEVRDVLKKCFGNILNWKLALETFANPSKGT